MEKMPCTGNTQKPITPPRIKKNRGSQTRNKPRPHLGHGSVEMHFLPFGDHGAMNADDMPAVGAPFFFSVL